MKARLRCPVTNRTHDCNRAWGFSLLEVVTGLVVVSMIMIPTTSMMKDVLRGEATQRARAELTHLAQGKQTEICHLVRANFQEQTQNGNFSAEGQPDVLFTVEASEDPGDGGISDLLMALRTLVWQDANSDGDWDSGEPAITLWTTVARAVP